MCKTRPLYCDSLKSYHRSRGAPIQLWGALWAGSFPSLQYHADIPSICSEHCSSVAGLSCHIVEAHIFSSKQESSQRSRRLTALIGGYQFVCSGSVPDNSNAFKRRGGTERERAVGVVDVGWDKSMCHSLFCLLTVISVFRWGTSEPPESSLDLKNAAVFLLRYMLSCFSCL